MIATLNVPVAAFEAAVDVAIAMVILNAKPQYEAGAVYVIARGVRAADEIFDVVIAVFYRKLGVAAYFVCRHVSVAGGDERVGVGVYRARAFLHLSGEKVVEAAVILLNIVAHVKRVCADKAVDTPGRELRVHISADHCGKYRVSHYLTCRPAEMLEIAACKADGHFL